ncbi:MAG: adenylosuccinate lyase family protein, partial [Pseudomonadota bacterium]|nr:adenylosuccinate lyase family protein [Pseudomonadota bacterium]
AMTAALLSHPCMSQDALKDCRDADFIASMLAFELALVRAQERIGAVPPGTAADMAERLEHHAFDVDELARGVASGGNPAIPFVKAGRGALPDHLKRYWHQGATSQDVVDSALMHLLTPRLGAIDGLLERCRTAGMALMRTHADTPMVGRTLMQQALPITFGAKVAQWTVGLEQARRRLGEVADQGLPVQFGGAVGVHSGWGDEGMALMQAIAQELGLSCPILPWHTNRQPIHTLQTALDAVAGAVENLALDVSLLTQTEVGEVSEPSAPGMGESSSMPHKRNPVRCALIRSSARRLHGHTSVVLGAVAQPLERGLGEWHAEWVPLTESVLLVEGALEQAAVLLEGLEIHPERMAANLAVTGGAIMAEPVARLLTPSLGPERAKALAADAAEQARQQGRRYADVLVSLVQEGGDAVNSDAGASTAASSHASPHDSTLPSAEAIRAATDPALYIGSSKHQVRAALEWLQR